MSEFHIIAPFHISGGGNWAAIDLYYELRVHHAVKLWSPKSAANLFQDYTEISEIRPYSGQLPNKGTLVIGGTRTELGPWFDQIKFDRVVLIQDEFTPLPLYKALHRIARSPNKQVEIQYVSDFARKAAGLDGTVRYPIPHPRRFTPMPRQTNPQYAQNQPFIIGRISRDTINKHYYHDPALYRALAQDGFKARLAGATCLEPWLGDAQSDIELLPELSQTQVPQFLASLDCFYYRTSNSLREAFGLVVIEAMLSGLPVVCHRQGGYAEVIEHGKNGFLFSTDSEAIAIIHELRQNPELALEVGKKARESALSGF